MTIQAAIGEKLKETLDFYRGEAAHYTELANKLNEAWGTWDIDALRDHGFITEREAQQLREEQQK